MNKLSALLAVVGLCLGLSVAATPVAAQQTAQSQQQTSQRVEPPVNGVPCRYKNSNHCTHSAKWFAGPDSWWRGASKQKHYVTQKRATNMVERFFRYYNWHFDGKVSGHPYCWDKGSNMRCGDGYFRYLG